MKVTNTPPQDLLKFVVSLLFVVLLLATVSVVGAVTVTELIGAADR